MNKNFDIDALRAMVVGIELQSFARAATQLCRSQSAISMQLKKLEQQAGTPLFVRKGRGLVPTEAGEALARYARQIIALNDEAALALGASVISATVRLGLPQDFFDDVMPATLSGFAKEQPGVHVEVKAGLNYSLSEEVQTGRLDGAIVFFAENTSTEGELLGKLSMHWLAHREFKNVVQGERIPLVLFDHPCLFRQAAIEALDRHGARWNMAVTTPSLPGIWGALRSHLGVAVRTTHGLPDDIVCINDHPNLPVLPKIELRLLRANHRTKHSTKAASDLCDRLKKETLRLRAFVE